MTIDVTQKGKKGKGGQRRVLQQKLEVRTSDESNRGGGTDRSGAGDNFVTFKSATILTAACPTVSRID